MSSPNLPSIAKKRRLEGYDAEEANVASVLASSLELSMRKALGDLQSRFDALSKENATLKADLRFARMSESLFRSVSCEIFDLRKMEFDEDPVGSLNFFAARMAEIFTSDVCDGDEEAHDWWECHGGGLVGDSVVCWDDDLHEIYPEMFQPGQTLNALYVSYRDVAQ